MAINDKFLFCLSHDTPILLRIHGTVCLTLLSILQSSRSRIARCALACECMVDYGCRCPYGVDLHTLCG